MDSPGPEPIDRRAARTSRHGVVSLPAKYTLLRIARPAVAARHFIEYFMWVPDVPDEPAAWTLEWILAEIIGREYVPITGEPRLVTVKGGMPPATIDSRKLARVYVNGYGEAEWEVLVPALRRGTIPWRVPR
jgi:hypothetical protein